MAGRGSLAGLMPYSDANAVVVDMVYHTQCRKFTKDKGLIDCLVLRQKKFYQLSNTLLSWLVCVGQILSEICLSF
jgi:hypothetical protein